MHPESFPNSKHERYRDAVRNEENVVRAVGVGKSTGQKIFNTDIIL